MPHVIVKLWPGNSEQEKARLVDAIAKEVMEVLGFEEVSVCLAWLHLAKSECLYFCQLARRDFVSVMGNVMDAQRIGHTFSPD